MIERPYKKISIFKCASCKRFVNSHVQSEYRRRHEYVGVRCVSCHSYSPNTKFATTEFL
uniref:DNL-type domain-containing protein n=1 Tax=Ascaris lumbricoides TaxID=6252 RepID=A0A0M3HXJ9_ASCLU